MDSETQVIDAVASGRPFRHREHGGSNNTVVIGPRDSLIGKLTVDGEVRIQGLLEGELHASGDVHVEGKVNAPIEARNVTVRGEVNGDVTARERLLLAGSGMLSGNVKIGKLSIEEGATLNGNVTMSAGKGGGSRGGDQNEGQAETEG